MKNNADGACNLLRYTEHRETIASILCYVKCYEKKYGKVS